MRALLKPTQLFVLVGLGSSMCCKGLYMYSEKCSAQTDSGLSLESPHIASNHCFDNE